LILNVSLKLSLIIIFSKLRKKEQRIIFENKNLPIPEGFGRFDD